MDRRIFLASAGAACFASTARASGADWSDDIRILRRAFELIHPGLYRYAAPAEMAARFDRLERTFAAGPSLGAAYLALAQTLAAIKCGHTYPNFFNQSEAVAGALFSGKTRLPFHFKWIGGRMVVTANQSDDPRMARGAQVSSVNGVSTKRLYRELLPLVRADGGNDAKRRALLEVQGREELETFDIYHALAFGPIGDAVALKVRSPNGAERRLDAATIDLAARRAAIPTRESDNPLGWSLQWPNERAALLTMPNWAAYNVKWDWIAWLDGVFAEIADRKATALIVDLRENEGGNDCGDEILARLIDKDLETQPDRRLLRFVKTPPDLDPFLDTWDDSFRDWTDRVTPVDARYFERKAEAGTAVQPKAPRFAGKVFVLTSPVNSSATFRFAELIRANGLGLLIGEPTGGNRRGINGGAYFFLRLPNSGLEADLPLIGYFPRTPQPDAGLLPDVDAGPTAADIRDGRDRALETALALSLA